MSREVAPSPGAWLLREGLALGLHLPLWVVTGVHSDRQRGLGSFLLLAHPTSNSAISLEPDRTVLIHLPELTANLRAPSHHPRRLVTNKRFRRSSLPGDASYHM